jgi:predicted GIY-YIG superfamily endonuclease
MKQPCVYIVASKRRGTLYTGVTANCRDVLSSTAKGW